MKKYFNVIVCLLLLIVLTSCGISSNKKDENDNKAQDNSVIIDKIFSTSNNYAIVKGTNNKIYIVDKNDYNIGIINNSNNYTIFQINNDGYVYAFSDDGSEVFDKEGKLLYKSSDDISYVYGISSSNDIIRKNGNKYEVVDMSNNVIHYNLKFEDTPVYVGGNYYIINNSLFNITSGMVKDFDANINIEEYKINKDSDYIKNYKELNSDNVILDNKFFITKGMTVKEFDPNKIIPINDMFYLNLQDNRVYTFNNVPLKETKINGSIKSFFFENERYYFGTDDGYFYVFDKSFKEVNSPVKLGNKIRLINEYGVFANKESTTRKTALFDLNGELKKDFGDYYLYDIQDFVAKTFIDGVSNDTPIININTFNEFKIYK